MFRLNLVALLAGSFVSFASAAVAQDSTCPQPAKKPTGPCTQRQNPYEESKARRSIAPRILPEVYEAEAARSVDAANVVKDAPGQDMIRDAKAIAVIPGMKKGAFIFGGRWGKGLMTKRDPDGHWQPPSFIEIAGGNVGFQAGYQSTDLVLIFTDERAIQSVLRGKLTLNADASAAAGPIGRKLQVGVPILLNAGIYAYSRSHGIFAGISLDGATIKIDDTSNQRVYGKCIDGSEILLDRRVLPNTVVAPFLNAMESVSPGPRQQASADATED